jgi:hypothetical protein
LLKVVETSENLITVVIPPLDGYKTASSSQIPVTLEVSNKYSQEQLIADKRLTFTYIVKQDLPGSFPREGTAVPAAPHASSMPFNNSTSVTVPGGMLSTTSSSYSGPTVNSNSNNLSQSNSNNNNLASSINSSNNSITSIVHISDITAPAN